MISISWKPGTVITPRVHAHQGSSDQFCLSVVVVVTSKKVLSRVVGITSTVAECSVFTLKIEKNCLTFASRRRTLATIAINPRFVFAMLTNYTHLALGPSIRESVAMHTVKE